MRALRAKGVLVWSSHNEFDLFFTHHGLRGPINNHDLESVLAGILIASRVYGKHAARVARKVFYCKDINQNVKRKSHKLLFPWVYVSGIVIKEAGIDVVEYFDMFVIY